MNVKRKFSDDQITIIICLCMLAIGYYALVTDFSFFKLQSNNRNTTNGENKIGKIYKVDADARIRPLKNIFWSDAKKNDSVGLGDSLFVGNDSSLQIKFEDGKVITISANSFIKFNTENNKVRLSLQYGSIKSDSLPEELILDDCGETINIKGKNADVEIAKSSDCGRLKIKSKSGGVSVNDKSIEKNKNVEIKKSLEKLTEKPLINLQMAKLEGQLSEEEGLNVSLPEIPTATEINTSLAPPRLLNNKLFHPLASRKPATVGWTRVTAAKEYSLETSESPNFENAKSIKTTNTTEAIAALNQDKIFYRLKAISEDGKTTSDYSETGSIEFSYPSIQPKNPHIKINYIAKNPKDLGQAKEVSIQWNAIPQAEKYVIFIDRDPSFKNAKSIVTRKPAGSVIVPSSGSYNYKIAAYNSQKRQISSTNDLGEIIYNRIFSTDAPSIEKSAEKLTYFFQKGLGKFIWLKWITQNSENSKYRVELAKDQTFSNVLKAFETKNKRLLIQDKLPEGEYYWRVRTENNLEGQSQVSDWSNLGLLNIVTNQN